jgi:hypothetical protein
MRKSTLFRAGILSISLVFGLVLLGCPTDTTEETDTWSNVTSLDQLNGAWKGSHSQTMTIKEAMGETWNDDMQTIFGDIKVTANIQITITIDATAKTQALSMTAIQTFSGGNINTVWTMISGGVSGQEGVTVDNAKHSITITMSQSATSLSDTAIAELLDQGIQVNQNGKKVKVPADTIPSLELPEIVLTK